MLVRLFSALVVLAALFCSSVSSVTPAHAQQKERFQANRLV